MKSHILTVLIAIVTSVIVFLLLENYVRTPLESMPRETRAKAVSNMDISKSEARRFLSSAPTSFTNAARKGMPSVVHIYSRLQVSESDRFSRKVLRSTGSGVIIDSNGIIVTNYHVVKDAISILVTLHDRKEYAATLLGYDTQTDIAILKIEKNDLPVLTIGNSDSLSIGEWILAIGNPFELQSSVTAGIVSAKARSINLLEDSGVEAFIQTDAAVNSGNSGGALINTNGELVGINTAIMSNSGGYQGFSFAIPINIVRKVSKDILEYGVVQRGWLGAVLENIDQNIAELFSLSDVNGVRIISTRKDGAAQAHGLTKDDIITHINGHSTQDLPTFMEQLSRYRPGDDIEIKYFRKGNPLTVNVTLRNQMNSTDLIAVRRDAVLKSFGLEIRNLTRNEQFKFAAKGAYVVSITHGSKADKSNMKPGYVITDINNTKIDDVQDVVDILEQSPKNKKLNFDGFYAQYTGKYPYIIER